MAIPKFKMPPYETVAKEAKRPAVTFMIGYGIVFLTLVAYKFQTRSYYVQEHQQLLEEVTQRQLILAEHHVETIRQRQIGEQLSQHEDELNNLLKKFQEKEEEMNLALNFITSKKSEIDELDRQLREVSISTWENNAIAAKKDGVNTDDESAKMETSNIQHLMSISDLSQVGSMEDVNDLFHKSMDELDTIIKNANNDYDSILEEVFNSNKYPNEREKLVATNESCGGPSAGGGGGSEVAGASGYPRDAATHKDLTLRVQKIETMLSRRGSKEVGIHHGLSKLFFPESVSKFNKDIKAHTEQLIEDIFKYADNYEIIGGGAGTGSGNNNDAKKQTSTNPNCIAAPQVMELMDEGLLAMIRKADIRNTLRKKAMEINAEQAAGMILDADLPPVKPQIPEEDSIILSRILDTPLLQHSAIWIDNLIEACSGYNDAFDNYLDNNYSSSRESIGEMFVRGVLEKSANVQLPTTKQIINKLKSTPLRSLLK